MSLFRRNKPSLRVVSNPEPPASKVPFKEIIITAGVTALAVAIVGDIYRGAKKRVLNRGDGDDEMMQELYRQQPQQPQYAAAPAPPGTPPLAAPPSDWESRLREGADKLKTRSRELDEREDDLVARERRARLME